MVPGMKAKRSVKGYYREEKALCHRLLFLSKTHHQSEMYGFFSHTERCDFTSDSCEMDCYPGIANDQVFKGQCCDRHWHRLQNNHTCSVISLPQSHCKWMQNRDGTESRRKQADSSKTYLLKWPLQARRTVRQAWVNIVKVAWRGKDIQRGRAGRRVNMRQIKMHIKPKQLAGTKQEQVRYTYRWLKLKGMRHMATLMNCQGNNRSRPAYLWVDDEEMRCKRGA